MLNRFLCDVSQNLVRNYVIYHTNHNYNVLKRLLCRCRILCALPKRCQKSCIYHTNHNWNVLKGLLAAMWRCGIFKWLLKSSALIGVKSHRLHLHLHLHCELSHAFLNCLPEYMLNHKCCIYLTFLHCVFSNVSSNSWEDIKSHWLHLFDFFVFYKMYSQTV